MKFVWLFQCAKILKKTSHGSIGLNIMTIAESLHFSHFLCMMKQGIGLLLTLGMHCSCLLAQEYHAVDYGRTGQIPALLQGFSAHEDDISAEAEAGWIRWMGASTAPERSSPLPLGFTISIGGTNHTHVRAASNGYITFDTSAPVAPVLGASTLPLAALPSPSLYFGGLYLSGSNDRLLYRTVGTAPNRALWIKWYSASGPIPGNTYTYAAAVIMENGTLWTGLLHTGSAGPAYQAPELSFGFQLSASKAFQMEGSPAITADSGMYGPGSADNRYTAYIPGGQSSWDAQWIEVPKRIYATRGRVAVFEARMANVGSRSFSNVELEYRLKGQAGIVKQSVIVSLDSINRVGVLRDTLPQFADTGIYELEVRFSSLDGNIAAASRPVTLDLMLDQGKRVPRRGLVEMQTASWCATCPAYFQQVRELESKYQAVSLFHHVGDGMAHDSFKNLGAETVPAFAVNGTFSLQADTAAWIQSLKQQMMDGAPCSLKVLKTELSALNELRFEVETRFEDLYLGDLRLFVALRERTVRGGGLPFDQFIAQEITTNPNAPYYQFPNQTGGFKHPDVAWVFLTPYGGMRNYIPTGANRSGALFTKSFSFNLPSITSVFIPAGAPYSDANANAFGRYKPAETDIVAVLWDHSNPLKPEVIQATVQPLWDAANGWADNQEAQGFDIWPNPASARLHVYFPPGFAAREFTLLDVSGRVCMQGTAVQREHVLDVSALKPGVYWLRVGSAARKLVVAP